MSTLRDWLRGKKTYIVAFGSIVAAFVGWATETLTTAQAVEAIVAAILAATIRSGITTEAQRSRDNA